MPPLPDRSCCILYCLPAGNKELAIAMFEKIKTYAQVLKREVKVYRLVLADPRTPWFPKVLLGASIAYLLSPIDLIPDFIPVLGHLDDLILIPALVWLALKMIPDEVIADCRDKVQSEFN